jgi:ribosome biogenesis GTPase
MMSLCSDLADLGWNAFFASQIEPDHDAVPARVMAVHRDRIRVAGGGFDMLVPPAAGIADDEAKATVGDWVLLEPRTLRPRRLLQRRSLLKRRAAGTGRDVQLIAANVDTLLVVSSCNQDFNPARLERYLALARACDVTPVIVLTKADLVETPQELVRAASRFLPDVLAEALDARDPLQALRLAPWCAPGQTVALVGSSGVGKSTLVNTLTGVGRIATQPVRLDDDRGRHTTTARTLHRLAAGGWLLDTPGMRELQLTDSAAGLDDVFADIAELARQCRFGDCRHETEPGCAILSAIAAGSLEAARVRRWHKLAAGATYNTESLARRRARDRAFGRTVRTVVKQKRSRQDE